MWGIIVLLLIILGYFVWGRPSSTAGTAKNTKQGGSGVPVSVGTVTKGNMGVYINSIATVTPVYTATVASRVVGELIEVDYKEGQMVKKGDLLAVIDPRPYEAAYVQAQGQLARDQALLANARVDLNRYRMAYEQHAIPEQTLATQEATVAQDEGTVKLDEGNLDAAKVNLDYTRITAPISGRVGLRTVDPGNIVPANGTTGLVTITQLQPITVIFPMAEDYISDVAGPLRAGRSLRVDALDRENQHELAQGTVLTIDNQVDTTTGTVRVRATFQNENYILFPNEFVNAKLLVKTLYGANIVPTAAIQRNSEQAFVYVVDPATTTAHTRNIQIATEDGNNAAVMGVTPGEVVVTDGFDQLQDGTKVVERQPSTGATPKPAQHQTAAPTQAPAPNNAAINPQPAGKK